jgi:hypothetical protein
MLCCAFAAKRRTLNCELRQGQEQLAVRPSLRFWPTIALVTCPLGELVGKRRSPFKTVILCPFIFALTSLQHGWAQSGDPWESFKLLYSFDAWAGQTKTRYERLVTNWIPEFDSMGVTNFLLRDEAAWTNFQKDTHYIFHPSDAPAVDVQLKISERQDVTNAHLAMLERFFVAAAPQPFPLGSSLGVDVGDRCYLGWGPVGDSVSFLRNNVFVSLSASGYSVLSLAQKLDSELVIRSFAGPVLLQPGISERAFHLSVPTVAGKTYVIESTDSLATTNWTALPPFPGDGTIRRVTVPAWSPHQFFRLRIQ